LHFCSGVEDREIQEHFHSGRDKEPSSPRWSGPHHQKPKSEVVIHSNVILYLGLICAGFVRFQGFLLGTSSDLPRPVFCGTWGSLFLYHTLTSAFSFEKFSSQPSVEQKCKKWRAGALPQPKWFPVYVEVILNVPELLRTLGHRARDEKSRNPMKLPLMAPCQPCGPRKQVIFSDEPWLTRRPFSKQNILNDSCNRVFEITAAPFPTSDLLSIDKPQPHQKFGY